MERVVLQYSPSNLVGFVWFGRVFQLGGSDSDNVLTLDTTNGQIKNGMTDGVPRSPDRLCGID